MTENAVNLKQEGPIVVKRVIPINWMSKLSQVLSGFGRMVIYENHNKMNQTYELDPRIRFDPRGDNSTNHVIEIKEGDFKFGKLNGYGRVVNAEERARVGYFKDDKDYGKMIYYKDGVVERQGVVRNDSFEKAAITDLSSNVADP